MTRMSKAALLALAVGLITVVIAAPAQAKRFAVTGQQTTVTPSAQLIQFLTNHGITATPVGAATASGGSVMFPIARGHVTTPSLRGVLIHRGGLKFAKGSRSITLSHLVISRTKRHAILSVLAGKRTLKLARIANPTITTSGKSGTLTGELTLTHAGARAINHFLHKHVAAAGFDLGKVASTITVA